MREGYENLNAEDVARIEAWRTEKGVHTCPRCASRNLKFSGILEGRLVPRPDETTRSSMPMLAVVCGDCGAVELYSAEAAGLAVW